MSNPAGKIILPQSDHVSLLMKSPSISPSPQKDKGQAPQYCRPGICPFPSSISLVASHTVHAVSQPCVSLLMPELLPTATKAKPASNPSSGELLIFWSPSQASSPASLLRQPAILYGTSGPHYTMNSQGTWVLLSASFTFVFPVSA